MEYLVINSDGELHLGKGDPTTDQDELARLEDGDIQIIRYHGNTFQVLVITDSYDGPEEDDPREYETKWQTVTL